MNLEADIQCDELLQIVIPTIHNDWSIYTLKSTEIIAPGIIAPGIIVANTTQDYWTTGPYAVVLIYYWI